MFLRSAALLLLTPVVLGLPNGYGYRPGMGWEGDYQNPLAPGPGRGNASYIASIAHFMASGKLSSGKTLKQLGYWYVNPSSSWDEMTRTPSGQLQPRKDFYPDGIEPTVSLIHSLNLSYGSYGDRGNLDCDKRPGQLGHEMEDAKYFASIGVDWFKEDSCYDSGDQDIAIQHYATMRDAFNASGRKIWFALCGWKPWYASRADGGNVLANSARIGPDTGGGWQAVLQNVDNSLHLGQYAGAHESGGFWNDGSLQLAPGVGCHSNSPCSDSKQCTGGQKCENGICQGGGFSDATCMTQERHRSQFSLWCILGMNLVMTGNLPLIAEKDPYNMDTWSNGEAIAVNQDASAWSSTRYGDRMDGGPPLAGGGELVKTEYSAANVAECGGEPQLQQWLIGPAVNNTVDCNSTGHGLYLALADCTTELIYDGCSFDPKVKTCSGVGNYSHFMFDLKEDSSLRSRYNPDWCVTVNTVTDAVSAAPCTSPLQITQKWNYTSGNIQTQSGKCLTAAGAAPTNKGTTAVFGRPLTSSDQHGAYAILLLNNDNNKTNVTCDTNCIQNMKFPADFPLNQVYIRDLWMHKSMEGSFNIMKGFEFEVEGGGASMMMKICASQQECTQEHTLL
eukprot:m.3834 g.3834  ORF g.3834 m.3834 type:complete len:618 (-) comp2840_c0_seq1:87-1940(-)